MLRGLLIGAFFFTATPILISIQALLDVLRLPGRGAISKNYYRVLCRLLRIRVKVSGAPPRGHAALIVSNHVSWTDILVIGSIMPVAFIAKREVAGWPLVGITAKVQRTVFVDRTRRQNTGATVEEIAERLASGLSVVLFAEGTSSDGNRVLPFRSSLLGAVTGETGTVPVVPACVSYVGFNGMAMGRQHRPVIAWYGDIDFMPHIRALINAGAVDTLVSFGEPMAAGVDRKAMSRALERSVRLLMAQALRGRAMPKAGVSFSAETR